MSPRLLLCLLLFCAALPVAARDVKFSGANGDGGTCPEQAAAAHDDDGAANGGKRAAASPAARDKPQAASRGENQNAVRPPRWHSFLPGMFR